MIRRCHAGRDMRSCAPHEPRAGGSKKMRAAIAALLVAVAAGAVYTQEKGGDDRTGPYDVVAGWPQPLGFAKPGYIWSSIGGIFAESPDRVFIANRGELK